MSNVMTTSNLGTRICWMKSVRLPRAGDSSGGETRSLSLTFPWRRKHPADLLSYEAMTSAAQVGKRFMLDY